MNEKRTNQNAVDEALTCEGWQSRYVAGTTGWDRGEPNPALLRWLEHDLQPSRILVPGCGRGHEVVELASRGFTVTALDYAMAPVQELTRKLTDQKLVAEVVREDVLHFATQDKFDAIYEQTCLCALEPKHWPVYEPRMAIHLRPAGKLFALFMQSGKTDGPPFSCDISTMKTLFHQQRWIWPADQFQVEHPSGMTEIALILQRRDTKTKTGEPTRAVDGTP